MDETFFYIAGGVLVALALIISLIGMRSEKFPTNGQLWVGVVLTAVVVVAASAGAVSSSQKEAEHREAENAEAAETLAEDTAEREEEAGGGTASSSSEEPEEDQSLPGDDSTGEGGEQVFIDNGCGSCHTLAELPEAAGTIGPNLDEALVDKDEDFILTSIIAPDDFVEEGYGSGIMPQNYEELLAPEDIDALVTYLAQTTSRAGEPSGGDQPTSSK